MDKKMLQLLFSNHDIQSILDTNTQTKVYGLQLSPKQALALKEAEQHQLALTNRIALNDQLIPQLIARFKSSDYIFSQNYELTIHDLIESFYDLKNIAGRNIADNDLIYAMYLVFTLLAKGDIQYMHDVLSEKIQESFLTKVPLLALLEYDEEEYMYLEEAYGLKEIGN